MRFRSAILAAVLLLGSAPSFSQGCAMCSTTAKATSKDGIRALAKGVVALLVPSLTFMTLGVWIAIRYSKRRDDENAARPASPLP
jgi:hypothetical protein